MTREPVSIWALIPLDFSDPALRISGEKKEEKKKIEMGWLNIAQHTHASHMGIIVFCVG